MRSVALTGYGMPLEMRDSDEPMLESGDDVIVAIAAAGVCGSDVHLQAGAYATAERPWKFPYTLGHENAGFVHSVGDNVGDVSPGDPVLLHPIIACGLCSACRSGMDMHCTRRRFPGIDGLTQGGFADLIKTSARSIVKLDTHANPVEFASLADAGLTAYHALRRIEHAVLPGQVIAVIGVGGVGQFCVQLASVLTPATVIAMDVRADRVNFAEQLGAHKGIDTASAAEPAQLVQREFGGVDIVMDCVGSPATIALGLELLNIRGTYVLIGSDASTLSTSAQGLTAKELTVMGTFVGTYLELSELVTLKASGAIRTVEDHYSLGDAEKAIRDLEAGISVGRPVLVP